ncbi:hypothetical protein [Paenibacillus sp. 23TSA30-6]|uniref:hypothetical protein n=1 Tax=Paenibacillus sp. 23TSA30-6 TaxID=2546104 RepID=UPI001787EB8C|nr:hypothetical protein [Paenibacillus sp. 23TSA30-6]MBE0334951.1 hypothetical protein [Paenibacillus sp. 23TSA30-6]
MTNRIKIKFGQIEFEAEGDSELIEREREQFFSLLPQAMLSVSPSITVIEQPKPSVDILLDTDTPQQSLPTGQTYESLITFLKAKNFQSDVERVLGVAYYIDQIEKSGPVTAREIETKLLEARQGKPSNTSHVINQNIKKGYLYEHSEKKEGVKSFFVLQAGIDYCESYVPTDNTSKKKDVKLRKLRVTKESSLLQFSLDELNLEKYIDVSSIENFVEQALVIMLIYTNEKNIEYFSYLDIESVMKQKFKISATNRKVRYVFDKGGTKFDKKIEKGITYHRMLSGAIREAESIVTREQNKLI